MTVAVLNSFQSQVESNPVCFGTLHLLSSAISSVKKKHSSDVLLTIRENMKSVVVVSKTADTHDPSRSRDVQDWIPTL